MSTDLNAALARLGMLTREPAYRYFESSDGWRFCWTTERMDNGKFVAFAYKPVGPGARSGNPQSWELTYERPYNRRKDAKERAWAMYRRRQDVIA